MPHRVANFFRGSASSVETQVANIKKKTAVRPANNRSNRSAESVGHVLVASTMDDASTGEDATANPHRKSKRGHSSERHDHHRISFPSLHFGRSSKESHANPTVSIKWQIESPPAVFYGDAENSTGALVSGLLHLNINDDNFQMESFNASLNIHVTQKRPFTPHCHDCTHQYTEIQKWAFLAHPLHLTRGSHAFPFSVLLGGHLPASLEGPISSIVYEFKAEAIPAAGFGARTTFTRILDVKRSLPVPEVPHHSVRVFPPTNIKASVHFPQVVHPTGQNSLTLRMDGVAKANSKTNTIEYWRLKKLVWRLEETASTVAPACERHAPRDKDSETPEATAAGKKGAPRTDTRTIGEKTLFNGWKSSYSGVDNSCVEMELDYGPFSSFTTHKQPHMQCDGKSRDGTRISHQLMVEMVVSQEWAPAGKPHMLTQTGVGRILRMHFTTIVTERGGIGISWDNESPPIYQDVPPSPPAYLDASQEVLLGPGEIQEEIEPLDASRRSSTT